jgi:endonuclease YncB( thermonuclease family)
MKRYILLLAICFIPLDVQGASLFGKVIEVNSGDVLTIYNLNRPVRVKLLGVDAPEMNQAFGDVAKKHLADLILDKSVLVEYSGIASDSSLTGRVLLNDADIGAQMIRDGAAWFDTNTNRLTGTDRDVYQQSEQAARNERRGLWQQENPVAPWEFVREEALRRNPVASLKSSAPEAQPAPKRPVAELTNFTLMTAGIAAAPPPASVARPEMALPAAGPSRGNWRWLRTSGANFSALVPENGKLTEAPMPEGESHFFIGRDGSAVYVVSWVTAPSMGETDKDAIPRTLEVFLRAVGQGFQIGAESAGRPQTFLCELQNETSISQGGYTGSEYDLRSCTVPARARVFTRMVDDQRQMYIAVVFYMEEDENVSRFIKSFTIGAQKSKSRGR